MTKQPPGPIKREVCLWWRCEAEERRSSEAASEGKRQETVRSDCSCPLCFILFYKLHCLPWPDEYLMGICCFICMLYNLSPYNRNSGREAAVPALLSPTLPVLPEVPLDFLRRQRGKEKWLMSKRGISSHDLSLLIYLFIYFFVHAGVCLATAAMQGAVCDPKLAVSGKVARTQ